MVEHKRVGKSSGRGAQKLSIAIKDRPRKVLSTFNPVSALFDLVDETDKPNVYGFNGQLHGNPNVTKLGSITWQSPSHGKTQRDILSKTYGTIQGVPKKSL